MQQRLRELSQLWRQIRNGQLRRFVESDKFPVFLVGQHGTKQLVIQRVAGFIRFKLTQNAVTGHI